MVNVNRLKKGMKAKRKKESPIPPEDYVSSGCTELNLACSGHPDRGFPKGLYLYVIGDTSSGKTWLGHSFLAEASVNQEFDDYQLVYNNAENGALMNVRRYFGSKLADRIRYLVSTTLEGMYDDATETVENGPCIYVVDSMDSLTTKEEDKQEAKEKNARKSNDEAGGSYGTSKAKKNSAKLRKLVNRFKKSKSILIIISQTRQNIGFAARFNPRTHSGGDSLEFYARIVAWMKRKERVRVKEGKKTITIGQRSSLKITKNHLTGWEGEVTIPIFRKVGIDDVGGMIDYLIEWGHWKESKKRINAKEFNQVKKKEDLAAWMEATDNVGRLKKIVAEFWKELDNKVTIRRKPRYE